jgi:nicotinamide riboside transporter PnuC
MLFQLRDSLRVLTLIPLDWIAAVVTLVAVELVTRRRWEGFALHTVNAALWGYLMYRAQLWGLFTLEGVFAVQGLVCAYRWRRNARTITLDNRKRGV